MIIDITGIELIPGNYGKDCPGNGENFDEYGNPLELCCDECDFLRCCVEDCPPSKCEKCKSTRCPHSKNAQVH